MSISRISGASAISLIPINDFVYDTLAPFSFSLSLFDCSKSQIYGEKWIYIIS